MAGFDLNTQHSYTIPGGGRAESGQWTFDHTARTTEVPTRLLYIYDWQARPNADTNDLNLYTNGITTDMSISSGAVTFTRQTTSLDVSITFQYTLKGW